MIGKNQRISEEIKEEVRKHLETNENKHTSFQNLWDAAKAVLTGKLIVIQAYLKNQGTSPIRNLTYHLKELEKRTKFQVSRKKEIIKIRVEINRDPTPHKKQ